MAAAISAPAALTPDLLASEADVDQLPSSPPQRHAADAQALRGDEEEDEDNAEAEAEAGGGEDQAIEILDDEDDEEQEEDDYEILEDDPNVNGALAGAAHEEDDDLGAEEAEDGTDADELAGEEDPLGLGTHSVDADAGEDFLPTVLIEFEESLFDLFAQQAGDGRNDSEANAIPLKAPPDILDQPLSTLFATLRIPDALGEFLEKDTQLVLRSPEVDLEMLESDVTAGQVLLQDFLDIHPSNANGDAVQLRFAQRQPFLARFKALGGVVNPTVAATLSPTTAVSSWMSRAKAGSRKAAGSGFDEADELDDDGGDTDGVLGEHHEPDADEEGREAEWEEGEGDAQEHWEGDEEGDGDNDGDAEGDGEEEEEDEADDDVILIEDEVGERDLNLGGEEDYEDGDEEGDLDGIDGLEGEEATEEGPSAADAAAAEKEHDEYDDLDEAPAEAAQAEPVPATLPAEVAPTMSAWKEPASSAVGISQPNGQTSDADRLDEYETSSVVDAATSGAVTTVEKGASITLSAKRSFNETDDALNGDGEEDGAKRLKV
ncbi:hypothetical protein OC835_000095 [Tilletia horrida]|nr:hypothetical protein OC835_000095 [Tilletia horrida]